jgi:uncharacterized protein YndB with AHSA1/START domain
VPADVLANVSDPADNVPIEIEEGDVGTLRQQSTDRALAGAAGPDQFNYRIVIRPGGKWRVEYHCDFGGAYTEHGEFHEVLEPERLVLSLIQEDGGGNVRHRTLITVSFVNVGAKTEMTFTQTGFETSHGRDNNVAGWNECFQKLRTQMANTAG